MRNQPGVPERRQEDLRRRLAVYAETWRDDEFLDAMHDWAESGRRFTPAQADAIEDSLGYWQRRLNGPVYDPDRCPPSFDTFEWLLAGEFRKGIESQGWPCASRRFIYAEIRRVIERDKLRENYTPWRDEPGAPGWYRMLSQIIQLFTADEVDERNSRYAHEAFTQPGMITGLRDYLIDQAKACAFPRYAVPAATPPPTAERRHQVKQYIRSRKEHS